MLYGVIVYQLIFSYFNCYPSIENKKLIIYRQMMWNAWSWMDIAISERDRLCNCRYYLKKWKLRFSVQMAFIVWLNQIFYPFLIL